MASIANYGLKALITSDRICAEPGCPCMYDEELMRMKINKMLDAAHQLDAATFNAICLDLDQNPISDRPETSAGEKQRDDGDYDRVVEEAFKSFREKEREITLNAPKGSCVGDHVSSFSDDKPDDKFWIGATHLRHHLEFLFVLKGIKPSLLLMKYADDNSPLFSTVMIDCLVPIMDRLDLWSYGFSISFQSGYWVFYDARSPKLPLVKKAFLTHLAVKLSDPVTYPEDNLAGIPDSETAQALGYPVPFDDWLSGHFLCFRDATELKTLVSSGLPEGRRECVQGMAFTCPAGDELVWKKVLDLHRQCVEVAKSVGTELVLYTGKHPEMSAWLEENPDILDGISWLGGTPLANDGGPTLERINDLLKGVDLNNTSDDDLKKLLGGIGLRLVERGENVEGSGDRT